MSLPPPIKVGKLQTALHTKAKNSPDYRFYALYDKLYRRDVLELGLRPLPAKTAAYPGSTARVSPTSRSMDETSGWTN